MKHGWKQYTLSEVCSRIYSGGTPSTRHPEYWNGNIKWLSSGETSQRFIYDTERTITQEGVDNSSTKLAKKGCTVVATAGQGHTRGQASYLMTDTFINQSVIACEANQNYISPLYLYYNLDSRYEEFRLLSDGTSTRGGLSGWILKRMNIELPPLDVQQKIVNVLKLIDDKIELNTAINGNLEEQARALFKSWFIDFEPFGGIMPDDWQMGTLDQIAVIKTDSWAPKKNANMVVEHYSIPAFDAQHYPVFDSASVIKSNKYLLTKSSVMISKLNPSIKRIWRPLCLSECSVCSTEFIIYEAKNSEHKDFIYSILDSEPFFDYLCSHTTGSTNSRQRATPKNTLDYILSLPPDDIIKSFCKVLTPIYDRISMNIIESQMLSHIRDTLLPRLMSGELDVSELDI
ncbi:MAG: restriction endonuclease subunit S [bacterium]|nr:restriction endonuclease subunit S [bacterium]